MIFCPSCGKQLSDEESKAKFCAYCGAPLSSQEEKENDMSANVDEVKEGDTNKKFRPAVIATAILAVVIAFVLIFGGVFSSGYMTQMNTYIKLINKKNTDHEKFVKATSTKKVYDFYKTGLKVSEDAKDELKELAEDWDDIYDEIDDEYDKWKISFKVKSTEKGDKSDRKKLKENYEELYDQYYEDQIDELEDVLDGDELEEYAENMDVKEKDAKKLIKSMIQCYKEYKSVKVSSIVKVKGKFTIKADGKKYESDTVNFKVAKINGEWVLYELDSITFDDDDREDVEVFMSVFDNMRRTVTTPMGMMTYVE